MQLPGEFAPPRGRLLLALTDTLVAGVVGVRDLGDPAASSGQVCEVRRLFVRPQARKGGVGRALMTALIDAAHNIGYHEMRLESLDAMPEAQALYRSLGFVDTARYRPPTSEHDRTVSMAKMLTHNL